MRSRLMIDTLIPYAQVPYEGIQYTVCKDFSHVSRYRGLRQVIHNPDSKVDSRYIALETPNDFETNLSSLDVQYYQVPVTEENRLDLIANKFYGSASYAWVIAYFNRIEDGFSIREGQRLVIPRSLSSLFGNGEILAPVPVTTLNLGSE